MAAAASSLVFLLLLASASTLSLLFVSVSAQVFTSLNCGTSSPVTDGNLIVWLADNLYIQNGEPHVVSIPSTFSPVMGTLRAFTTRKKNCYTFDVSPGDIVLVRASFFYGNYDKKSSPPSFDIHFDGNYWVTVQTSTTDVVYYEVVYTVKGSTLSVCLAQTNANQFPFISALEVRGFDTGAYQFADSDYPLFLRKRVAFGAKDIIRFPDDAYDRIWNPAIIVSGSGLNTVTNDALFISTTDTGDKPPSSLFKNAVTPTNLSVTISLNLNLPSVPVPVYINTYYSEVSQLDQRSIEIQIDEKTDSGGPIIPPYGSALEWVNTNITASSSTSFRLVPTSKSALPPLINAMEVYVIGGKLSEGTNSDDVQALASLQDSFTLLNEWSGDPCLPSPYTWDWVACSSDAIPRITALLLSGLGLVGTLPDFSGMDALETIDLSKNSVTGEIPDFLGTLPKLKQLNLANNNFDGTVPSTVSTNKNIKLDISGNQNLCKTSDKNCKSTISTGSVDSPTSSSYPSAGTSKKKKKVLPAVLGAGIPIFLVFWVIVAFFAITNHRRKAAAMAAGQNQMGPGGKPGVVVLPGQAAMPMGMAGRPSNTTSVLNVMHGRHQNQEVPVYTEQDYQDAPANTDQAYQASPEYGQDYTEVPLYNVPSDVETGNPTTESNT